jgi:hypothetical protein
LIHSGSLFPSKVSILLHDISNDISAPYRRSDTAAYLPLFSRTCKCTNHSLQSKASWNDKSIEFRHAIKSDLRDSFHFSCLKSQYHFSWHVSKMKMKIHQESEPDLLKFKREVDLRAVGGHSEFFERLDSPL